MEQLHSLKNHLLIAMPALNGSWFASTVTYLCEHSNEGAMGIVLNKPLDVSFDDICEQLDITVRPDIRPMMMEGGPVSQEQGFILHKEAGDWAATLHITEQTHLTSSKDILSAIAQGKGPKHYCLGLGYAGWGAGQLEKELIENAWLTIEADPDLLFNHQARDLYDMALAKLGISAEFLSGEAGHA